MLDSQNLPYSGVEIVRGARLCRMKILKIDEVGVEQLLN